MCVDAKCMCFALQKTGWGPTFALAFAAVGVIFGAPGGCLLVTTQSSVCLFAQPRLLLALKPSRPSMPFVMQGLQSQELPEGEHLH